MNGRAFSWEIVLAGLLLTVVAIYINNSSDSSDRDEVIVKKSTGQPDVPEPPELPAIVLHLDKLKELGNLESLKQLEKSQNIDELRATLESLRTNMGDAKLDKSIKELDELSKLKDKSRYDVQVKDKEVIIQRSYDVPSGQWSEVSSGVFVLQEPLEKGLQNVTLNLAYGNITVTGSDDEKPQITVKASGNIDSADELAKKLNAKISNGSSTNIDVVSTEKFSFFNRININASLSIPRNSSVVAHTNGGHITLQNIDGSSQIKTSGGHLKILNVSGNLEGKTSGGHITGEHLKGNISLRTSGGHIELSDVEGNAELHTSGGHINLSELRASVEAKTNGGNISARIEELPGPFEVSTSAGNIDLRLNPSIGANVELNGSVVNLSDAFSFEGTKESKRVEGSINGGGPTLEANCNFGNVTLKPLN